MSRRRDEEFPSFIGERAGDPENIGGLCLFLKKIITTSTASEADNRLAVMMVTHFCDHVGDRDRGRYVWQKNPPSDLFYGIILAAIEDDATRNELQAQIESRSLALLMQQINEHKANLRMNHKEAFSHLALARSAEHGSIPDMIDVSRYPIPPVPVVTAVIGGRVSGTGETAERVRGQSGGTGEAPDTRRR